MTETSPLSFVSMPDDNAEIQTSTVGYIMEHVEVSFHFVIITVSLLN
jgi:hypothetical protein